jgi:hypothetical protein
MAVEVDQAHAATPEVAAPVAEVKAAEEGAPEPPKKGPTRCASCSKKVGLTGFVCRCGSTVGVPKNNPEDLPLPFPVC